ncbi:MAG: putative transporter [Planctomycetes bacterium]|nr:putative transporter [Planctomycetota bacterium]
MAALAAMQPVAHAILVLAAVAAAGLLLGTVKVRGIGLGTAGVLFAGILFGHLGQRIDHAILDFVKEFGLVLFVFTIGLQLGPGFVAALRRRGLRLNLLAAAVVVLGALATAAAAALFGIDRAASLGLLAGATTNTPSLGAAEQALATLPGPAGRNALPALAYAVAYPVGIAGIIGSMLVLRLVFRIDVAREAAEFEAEERRGVEPLERRSLLVENRNLDGLRIGEVPGRVEARVVISRIRHEGRADVERVTGATVLRLGDTLLAIGTAKGLEQFARVVGRVVDADLLSSAGPLTSRRIVVTKSDALGKSIRETGLGQVHGVTATRVNRAGIEMTAGPDLRLQFGDVLDVVGQPDDIAKAAAALGNSMKALNETQFIPLFLGIALGVVAGVFPFAFPGLPVPVRLGLAGGPLILAILLSRIGHIGSLVWHMPASANLAFRELGITLFLACVGLKAGERFFETVFTLEGAVWLSAAVLVAMAPLVLVGAYARRVLRLDFVTLTGLLAGSTTDPPALAFAGSLAGSDAPSVAYATVYPLTMLLRILVAQILALALCG